MDIKYWNVHGLVETKLALKNKKFVTLAFKVVSVCSRSIRGSEFIAWVAGGSRTLMRIWSTNDCDTSWNECQILWHCHWSRGSHGSWNGYTATSASEYRKWCPVTRIHTWEGAGWGTPVLFGSYWYSRWEWTWLPPVFGCSRSLLYLWYDVAARAESSIESAIAQGTAKGVFS